MEPGLSCGIFLDQGLSACPLYWQADSYLLCHQGSPCFGGFFLSLLNLLQFFYFMFWFFDCQSCRILAPWPGIEPAPTILEGEVLTTGPPGKSPRFSLKWTEAPTYASFNHHFGRLLVSLSQMRTLRPREVKPLILVTQLLGAQVRTQVAHCRVWPWLSYLTTAVNSWCWQESVPGRSQMSVSYMYEIKTGVQVHICVPSTFLLTWVLTHLLLQCLLQGRKQGLPGCWHISNLTL